MKRKELRNSRVADGLCMYCGKVPFVEPTKGCTDCNKKSANRQKKFISRYQDYGKEYRDDIRKTILEHYGNKCSCCGEEEPKFLALDHVNNDGKIHRAKLGARFPASSYQVYLWIRKNNYPDTFQILCHNCNMAKSCYGICPHKETV